MKSATTKRDFQYKKRSIVFQDITSDDYDKQIGFQSNHPLVITGFVSLIKLLISSDFEDCEFEKGIRISTWINDLWGSEMDLKMIYFSKIRVKMMMNGYPIDHLMKWECMMHAYLNEFEIYRIWNGVYDYVTKADHDFFMKFLIIISYQRRFEKREMIEMATEYFQYLEKQAGYRKDHRFPNHFYSSLQEKDHLMSLFFQPDVMEDDDLTIIIEPSPSPYMWDIHDMMKGHIRVITPSPRGFVPISSLTFYDQEEEKMDVDPRENEKRNEIEKIVSEVLGYISILYKDKIISERVNSKIHEWKESRIRDISHYLEMDVRNEVLKEVLQVVS